jgi:non-ribosomal peptide synthetase component F
MTLLAVFQVLLGRLARQTDVVVATPVANRTQKELEGLIGFFVNMLVLRTELSGDIDFVELLSRVRETALSAYAHQDLPFERLVEELNPERRLGFTPVFQAAFSLQNFPTPELALPGLELSLEVDEATLSAKVDVNLIMQRSPRGFEAALVYDPSLWNAGTIRTWAEVFVSLTRRVVTEPHLSVTTLQQTLDQVEHERRRQEQERFVQARTRRVSSLRRTPTAS